MAVNQTLAREARKNANSAFTKTFRMRALELGGFTERTRGIIRREATAAAKAAFTQTYTDAGYVHCGCGSLVAPAFARCFVCGAWKKRPQVDGQLSLFDRVDQMAYAQNAQSDYGQ